MTRQMAALVIGNADYPDEDALRNPVNDAVDLAAKLESYGFEVILATDCSHKEMEKQLKAFRALLETHEVGLFFFAGHGMQIEGINYLLAVDTDMDSEMDAKHSSLSLDKVVDGMAKSSASTKIIILDACRNNPWERRWHRGPGLRGLASVYAPKGTIIGFATSPGELASDGEGRNGTYTAALLQHIDTPDSTIETMFKRVRNSVAAATDGKQTSWEHTSLAGEFYFHLSLGKLIDDYDGPALADALFVLDEGKPSHRIIKGLKSHNWYRQNDAMRELRTASIDKMARNSLFVLGRNIYQAACGTADSAETFVRDFANRTAANDPEKRRALLDGILFEIFFDSNGALRKKIKAEYIDEAFDLQRHTQFRESFAFIADALTAARADFPALPGKGIELAVTVSTKRKKAGVTVNAVYIGGVDVLRRDEEWDDDDGNPTYMRILASDLRREIGAQLAVPSRLLKLTFAPADPDDKEELRLPHGWSVRVA